MNIMKLTHSFPCLLRGLAILGLAGVLTGCGPAGSGSGEGRESIRIAMLPKLVNIDYFDACHKGAKEAAEAVGAQLIYDGPKSPSGAEQNNFIETWIRQRVDAICVAPNQPKTIRRFVKKAKSHDIKVITWDSDAPQSGRDLFVNQVEEQALGQALIDDLAQQMDEDGKWAIAIASLDAHNLNAWRRHAIARAKEAYPEMTLVATEITKEDENLARQKVQTLLNAYPQLEGIIAFDSNSVPGAAEAIKRAGKVGEVHLTGCSTPKKMRPYIEDEILESFYLWDPTQLGGLTVRLAYRLAKGKPIKDGVEIPGYGKLNLSQSDPTTVIMSEPIRFTKENIDELDFGI